MMRPMPRHAVIAIAVVLCSLNAHADTRSFRCKNDLVKLGDAKSSALSKCGEPVSKDSFCKVHDQGAIAQVPHGGAKGATVVINNSCEKVDEWTYNPGPGQFMTTLRFESGVLVSITYGERVK